MRFLFLISLGVACAVAILAWWRRFSAALPRDGRARVPCDRCAELIYPEAKVCRYCGTERIVIRARE